MLSWTFLHCQNKNSLQCAIFKLALPVSGKDCCLICLCLLKLMATECSSATSDAPCLLAQLYYWVSRLVQEIVQPALTQTWSSLYWIGHSPKSSIGIHVYVVPSCHTVYTGYIIQIMHIGTTKQCFLCPLTCHTVCTGMGNSPKLCMHAATTEQIWITLFAMHNC